MLVRMSLHMAGEYRFDYNRFQYQQSGLADEWDGWVWPI